MWGGSYNRAMPNQNPKLSELAKQAGIPTVDLENYSADDKVLKLISAEQAAKWQIYPLYQINDKLTVALSNPSDLATLDEAVQALNKEIECVLADPEDLRKAINKRFGKSINKPSGQQSSKSKTDPIKKPNKNGSKNGKENTANLDVIELVDQILAQAFADRASDVHFEPIRDGLKIRFRIDGILELYETQPAALKDAILSRIKIMGEMDVAEHRLQQDGRVQIHVDDTAIDLRIATYPTMFGEAAAIRLHSKENLMGLTGLGFSSRDLEIFKKIVHQPHGIFLTTGPTGSGKTTTLYAALQEIDRQSLHVMSVEDPVENEIEGVDQTQINEKAGATFAKSLRGMLRQDPDVLMVGEIRDKETADTALSAAMTGHLVFSTLHTNTAIGAIARLSDLGVEDFLISSTLLGVLAQRLVRRICDDCNKKEIPIAPEVLEKLGPKGVALKSFEGEGCQACNGRGYKGRLALYELFHVDDEIRILIANKSPEVRLMEKAVAGGFHTVLDDGLEKATKGLTTIEEVLRVTGGL